MTLFKSTCIGAVLIVCVLAGCGGHKTKTPVHCGVPAQAGCSLPKAGNTLSAPRTAGRVFPDISEYQGCPSFRGPVIFKVYEGGYGQDHSALCNARRVHALGTWAGVYAFLRPSNCAGQGYATANIVRQIGGIPGPVVADAEVSLPTNCVREFLSAVRRYRGLPVDVYTSPGTWPGGTLGAPLWVATYGPRPGCVAGVCSHVAWQFTDNGSCSSLHGVDCSISTGILSQTKAKPKPPKPKPQPAAVRVRYLRSLARKHKCYTPAIQHRLRACKVWGAEVQALLKR